MRVGRCLYAEMHTHEYTAHCLQIQQILCAQCLRVRTDPGKPTSPFYVLVPGIGEMKSLEIIFQRGFQIATLSNLPIPIDIDAKNVLDAIIGGNQNLAT
jgi:hypothetical protein